jgi:hypothetical protein
MQSATVTFASGFCEHSEADRLHHAQVQALAAVLVESCLRCATPGLSSGSEALWHTSDDVGVQRRFNRSSSWRTYVAEAFMLFCLHVFKHCIRQCHH